MKKLLTIILILMMVSVSIAAGQDMIEKEGKDDSAASAPAADTGTATDEATAQSTQQLTGTQHVRAEIGEDNAPVFYYDDPNTGNSFSISAEEIRPELQIRLVEEAHASGRIQPTQPEIPHVQQEVSAKGKEVLARAKAAEEGAPGEKGAETTDEWDAYIKDVDMNDVYAQYDTETQKYTYKVYDLENDVFITLKDEDVDVLMQQDPETMRDIQNNAEQQALAGQTGGVNIATSVRMFRTFSQLSAYSSLIFDEGFLNKWKTSVNEFFCDTIVLGGIDCWSSMICGRYTDIVPSRNGVLYTGIGGAMEAAAHIEAQRSMPITTPNATYWGYTVTFSLTNPSQEEDMAYNVWFGGERSASWWSTEQTLAAGGTASAISASALYKVSSTNYNEVCLTFDPSIRGSGGEEVDKICNGIAQYTGGATAPYKVTAANETTAGAPAAPGTPATPGANI